MSKKTDDQATAAEEAVEQEFLQKQVGQQDIIEIPPGPEPEPEPVKYPQNMSSTVSHDIANIDFALLKLVN